MKKILTIILLGTLATVAQAQRILTLDSCRNLALANNKELRIAQEKIKRGTLSTKSRFHQFPAQNKRDGHLYAHAKGNLPAQQ